MNNSMAFDPRTIWRTLAVTTLVAGTLDIAGAMVLSALHDRGPVKMLQSIAGAILGKSTYALGMQSALLGLAIHFAIMSAMVIGFIAAASKAPLVLREPLVSGAAYGLLLYGVMYLIVLPLRWPSLFPTSDKATIVGQLVCHVLLVGLPIAFTAKVLLAVPSGR